MVKRDNHPGCVYSDMVIHVACRCHFDEKISRYLVRLIFSSVSHREARRPRGDLLREMW